jgi:hypothetical protein
MSLPAFPEAMETIGHGLVTSQASHVLKSISKSGRLPTDAEKQMLRDGKDLLDKFLQGTRLVEGDQFVDGLLPSSDSVETFRYVVSTLRSIHAVSRNEVASRVIRRLRDTLDRVITANSTVEFQGLKLDDLISFFETLGKLFSDDLSRSQLTEIPAPITLKLMPIGDGYPEIRSVQ